MDVSGQIHAPAALPPGKEPQYSLDRRLGGPQTRSGRGGEEDPILYRKSKPDPSSHDLVTIISILNDLIAHCSVSVVLLGTVTSFPLQSMFDLCDVRGTMQCIKWTHNGGLVSHCPSIYVFAWKILSRVWWNLILWICIKCFWLILFWSSSVRCNSYSHLTLPNLWDMHRLRKLWTWRKILLLLKYDFFLKHF
jgi:hypothetical protein